MTRMPPAEAKADTLARFADQGLGHINCAQAVVRFAMLVQGYDPDLIDHARYLGGGIAGMGEVCGAVSGSALSLGISAHQRATAEQADPPAPPPPEEPPMPDRIQALMREFTEQFGALRCRDLTGFDLSSPETRDAFHQSDVSRRCADYVGWACDRLAPLLPDA